MCGTDSRIEECTRRALYSKHTNRNLASLVRPDESEATMGAAKTDTRQATKTKSQEEARLTALRQIKARAKRDAREALQHLGDELAHYRTLDEGSDEALAIACGFAVRFIASVGSEVGITMATGCELWLDYDCDADIGICGVELDDLLPSTADIGYSREVFVRVDNIKSDLHKLLIELQKITWAYEEL